MDKYYYNINIDAIRIILMMIESSFVDFIYIKKKKCEGIKLFPLTDSEIRTNFSNHMFYYYLAQILNYNAIKISDNILFDKDMCKSKIYVKYINEDEMIRFKLFKKKIKKDKLDILLKEFKNKLIMYDMGNNNYSRLCMHTLHEEDSEYEED